MKEILSNIKNNKKQTMLCILSIFLIELAPLIQFIGISNDDFSQLMLVFLFFLTCLKNFIFIFLYVLKNKFSYNILEKTLTSIKFRFLLFFVFLLCDAIFILFNTFIAQLNDYKTIEGVCSIYFGILPIYVLFLFLFSKKITILNSIFWTNLIFIMEKIFYFLVGVVIILYTTLMLLVLSLLSGLRL